MNRMPKNIITIGRQAVIDMPDFGIRDVPAKIDTGADSSSIWAGTVKEQDGGISFVLFDRESPYYTGKEINSREFEVVSVKNSFGNTEYRYKVKLPTKIEGKTIKVQYTLSDRAHSKYPVLIGRNTLRGKFLVDVSKKPKKRQTKSVLIFSKRHSDIVQKMVNNIQAISSNTIKIDYATYDDVTIQFIDGKMSVTIDKLAKDVSDYSLVHFKTSLARDVTAAIARYVIAHGGQVLDTVVKYFADSSKLYEYSVLANAGIRVPDSVFVAPSRLKDSYELFAEELGVPFVLKGIHASKGDLNDVIDSKKKFEKVAKHVTKQEAFVVAQKFIPNDGDYRVLVLGKKIRLVIHRRRKDDSTHLNNTSTGGVATLVPKTTIPAKVQIDCIHAAAILERDIAGADVIQDTSTGEWLFLEVNDGPQVASGAFTEEKHQALAKYFMKKLEK